jgi:hypothetical protein
LGSIVDELNRLVHGHESFYDTGRFAGVVLGADTRALLEKPATGEQLVELNRLLLRDGFAGTIADIPQQAPVWFPDYRAHYEKRFVELVERKAYAAKPFHRRVDIGKQNLAELFDEPARVVKVLADSDLIDIEHPRSSRLFEAMSFSGPMYKVFTEDEKNIVLDWIESLQKSKQPEEPSGPTPQEAAAKVLKLIADNAAMAMGVQRHAQYLVAGRPLKDWFSDPAGLMAAFARSRDWVVPGKGSLSPLYTEFTTGPMSFMLAAAEDIKQWIDTGAVLVDAAAVAGASAVSFAVAPVRQYSAAFVPPTEAGATAPVAVAPSVRAARREFAAKRKLIGMGAVH